MCIRDSAYTDVSTGKLILSAAAPVYDPSGKNVVGVAGLDIALDHINELFFSYTVGDNGFVILLTSDGTIIYHPNTDYQLKTLTEIGVSDNVVNALGGGNTAVKYTIGNKSRYGYIVDITDTVSYTHLDVYKRQIKCGCFIPICDHNIHSDHFCNGKS